MQRSFRGCSGGGGSGVLVVYLSFNHNSFWDIQEMTRSSEHTLPAFHHRADDGTDRVIVGSGLQSVDFLPVWYVLCTEIHTVHFMTAPGI